MNQARHLKSLDAIAVTRRLAGFNQEFETIRAHMGNRDGMVSA